MNELVYYVDRIILYLLVFMVCILHNLTKYWWVPLIMVFIVFIDIVIAYSSKYSEGKELS